MSNIPVTSLQFCNLHKNFANQEKFDKFEKFDKNETACWFHPQVSIRRFLLSVLEKEFKSLNLKYQNLILQNYLFSAYLVKRTVLNFKIK